MFKFGKKWNCHLLEKLYDKLFIITLEYRPRFQPWDAII